LKAEIERITGSVITATVISGIYMGEVVEVGNEGLLGEVIRVSEKCFTIQVYEPTSGLLPGEPVIPTGKRLTAELGPGLLMNVTDGIERPLEPIWKIEGPFLKRGTKISTLPRDKEWQFTPTAKKGQTVQPGDILGEVQETRMILNKIMVPPGIAGKITQIEQGSFKVDEDVANLETRGAEIGVKMMQEWPVRVARPFKTRLSLDQPLVTGQRVIDMLFPLAKGGTASIPGGFGTGKTVTLHQLIKWSDANVIVYVGCGERGNEICEVITRFPKLLDPKTGLPLMERTIIIANTSNMPVSAREASIYMGITIGEYYRDMGYDVALMADSTSRWAEALREISGRLEEMPSEKGYPAYLSDRIAEFYERAGRVEPLGTPAREGSVTVVGAVSPPGGDFNEPVTISTSRFTGVFWALDTELAYSRHFPAINWAQSYSLYSRQIADNWEANLSKMENQEQIKGRVAFARFEELRNQALDLLTKSNEIEAIARVIGEASLPDNQRLILQTAEILKEGFLKQNAYDPIDSFCPPQKQMLLLSMMMDFYSKSEGLLRKKVPIEKLLELPFISRMKRIKEDKQKELAIMELAREADESLEEIAEGYKVQL
jgi:V/A-type H+-transporting ATPase subunit A